MIISDLLLPLRSYKYLLVQLVQREIKARYKQSIVGYAWILLNPLAQLVVYSFVFSIVFRFPTNNIPYFIYLYAALLPWTFTQSALSTATMSLVDSSSLLRKVSFPREVIPYASVLSKTIDMLLSSLLFLGLIIIMRVPLAPTAILFLPIFAIQLVLTIGLSLFLSSLNLFYRDIQYLTNLVLMLWMYMTPIVYPLSLVPKQYVYLYKFNPLVGIIEGYRAVLFGYPIEYKLIAWSALFAVAIFIIGFTFFKRTEKLFADVA